MWFVNQEATILELMRNGTEALKILNKGKTLSSQRGSSFLTGRFHVAIGKQCFPNLRTVEVAKLYSLAGKVTVPNY